ncbi:MAG TPA: TetR/AcrR family transcriptional regulator [Bacillales bacterium]|nr:TetR/AcrR family transcriptional regulator [Bacillales bacterium]
MNEKGKQIIEASIKLFAKKGYHATSMQEIADESGVSKGSVYNHFDSKENLLLSIFQYYYELLIEKISRVSEDDSLSPRERLVQQVYLQFREFLQHRDFIEMQMREQAMQVNDEVTAFLFQIRAETLEWYKNVVAEVYGSETERYSYDLAAILHAMISEYFGYLILDKMELDCENLSHFIVDRLDDLVVGLARKQPEPMMRKGIVPKREGRVKNVHEEIERIRELAPAFDNGDDLLESLCMLEKELASEKPKKVIIQGMLAFLIGTGHSEIQKHAERIAATLALH